MLLGRGKFTSRPLQDIKLRNNITKQVLVSRCLGYEIDCQLNWNYHVSEVIKAFTQKLSLLKSLYFLPKVESFLLQGYILPSVTCELMIWSSCAKTLVDEIEIILVRTAKIIYKLDWNTPNNQVLVKADWNLSDCQRHELKMFAMLCI